jgi:hypothetical protein
MGNDDAQNISGETGIFRDLLEAQWAAFFDNVSLEYRYRLARFLVRRRSNGGRLPLPRTENMETERIVIDMQEDYGRKVKKAFQGRWIVGDDKHPEWHGWPGEGYPGGEGGYFAVAITTANRLVVLVLLMEDGLVTDMHVHEDYEYFAVGRDQNGKGSVIYPPSLIAAVAAELKIEHVEELDI